MREEVGGSSPLAQAQKNRTWLRSSVGQSAALSRRRSRVQVPSESLLRISVMAAPPSYTRVVAGSIPVSDNEDSGMTNSLGVAIPINAA